MCLAAISAAYKKEGGKEWTMAWWNFLLGQIQKEIFLVGLSGLRNYGKASVLLIDKDSPA